MDGNAWDLRTRTYGETGPKVVVLHGGPAAVGEAEPVARGLSKMFRVFEPFQRGSGSKLLTVATHVEDLHKLVQSISDYNRPSIVGESWGAMLALAYGSSHPMNISALVLIGCGTFDKDSRTKLEETVESRLDEKSKQRLHSLAAAYPDANDRLEAIRELTQRAYTYDPIPNNEQMELTEPFDIRAYRETWNDMLRLQEEGVYPRAFSAIKAPVLMLHGAYDPHPGRMIFETLKAHLPQLEFHELPNCGHSPWKERHARKEFFMVMSNWLIMHSE
jgi:pimeloyl-ACP methyl ester carboxylesterase